MSILSRAALAHFPPRLRAELLELSDQVDQTTASADSASETAEVANNKANAIAARTWQPASELLDALANIDPSDSGFVVIDGTNTIVVYPMESVLGSVTSFNGRTGVVALLSSDVTTALGFTPMGSPTTLTKTAAYSEAATSGIQVRLCNLAAGFTVTLPTAAGNVAMFIFKKMLAAGSIVIDGAGSETIDGALTATLTNQYEAITIVSDGSNWVII